MSVQIVTYKDHLFRIGILLVKKSLDFLSPINSGSLFSGIGETPSTEWFGKQKDATRAVPGIFTVFVSNVRAFGCKAIACLFEKLDGLFVHTNYRTTFIVRAIVYLKDILHRCHKSCAMFFRNTPAFLQVRLIFVFLKCDQLAYEKWN